MGIKYDLTNKAFGDFLAKEIAYQDSGHHNVWKLVCPVCGNTMYVRASRLMNGEADVHCNHDALHIPQHSRGAITTNPFVAPVDEDDYKDTMGYNNDDDCYDPPRNLDDALSTGYTLGVYRKQKVEDLKDTFQNGSLDDLMSSLFGPDWEKTVTPKTQKKNYTTPDDMPNNIHVSFDKDADILSYPWYYKILVGINDVPNKVSGIVPAINNIIGYSVFDRGDYSFTEVGQCVYSEEAPVIGLIIAEGSHKAEYSYLKSALEEVLDALSAENWTHIACPKIGCGRFGLEWKEVCSMILETVKMMYTNPDVEIYINFTAENPFEDEELVEDWGL